MVIILLGNRKCPGEQIFIYDTCNILCDKNKGDNKRYHITVYRTHIHTPAYITVYRTYIHTPAHITVYRTYIHPSAHINVYRTHIHTPAYITVYRTYIHTPAHITVYRTYIHTPAHIILNQFQHLNSKEKMEILTNKLNE